MNFQIESTKYEKTTSRIGLTKNYACQKHIKQKLQYEKKKNFIP